MGVAGIEIPLEYQIFTEAAKDSRIERDNEWGGYRGCHAGAFERHGAVSSDHRAVVHIYLGAPMIAQEVGNMPDGSGLQYKVNGHIGKSWRSDSLSGCLWEVSRAL